MKTLEYDLNILPYKPEYLDESNIFAFIDIETDGFNHFKNNIVLIGLNIVSNKGAKIIQLFANNGRNDEKKILTEFTRILKNIDMIYSYNGATFDIPFLSKKFAYYKLYNPFEDIANIDLIKIIRSNKNSLEIENCKLKTVEKYLGINREDSISGKDSILLYKRYLKNKSPAIEKTILKHNYDDILYLPKILEFEDGLRMKSKNSFIFQIKDIKNNSNLFLEILSIKPMESNIMIKGNTLNKTTELDIYGNAYNLNIDSINKTLELMIFSQRCKIGNEIHAKFIDLEVDSLLDYNMIKYKDNCKAKIPDNLLLLEFDQEILIHNIKNLLRNILKR